MKNINLLIALIVASHCSAQLPQCYVSTITGSATVARSAGITPLKKGDFIFKTDTIVVKNTSALTLIDYGNKYIVINKPGKFTYKDLQKYLAVKPTGITESFLKFVWEDLFKPETGAGQVSSSSIGGVTGGASRGGCDMVREPLNGSRMSSDTVYFSWRAVASAKLYRFTLQDPSRNDIINILTRDTSLAILKKDLMQADSASYFWNIAPDVNVSSSCAQPANYFILRSLPGEQKEVQAIIDNASADEDPFIRQLRISNILALKGWYKESFEYYLKAKEAMRK